MSDQDAADELIRNNAHHYNVVVHIPQRNSRVHFSSESLTEAIEYAETCYTLEWEALPRAAMVHAVDDMERFALMGTTNRSQPTFKPNVVKIY